MSRTAVMPRSKGKRAAKAKRASERGVKRMTRAAALRAKGRDKKAAKKTESGMKAMSKASRLSQPKSAKKESPTPRRKARPASPAKRKTSPKMNIKPADKRKPVESKRYAGGSKTKEKSTGMMKKQARQRRRAYNKSK